MCGYRLLETVQLCTAGFNKIPTHPLSLSDSSIALGRKLLANHGASRKLAASYYVEGIVLLGSVVSLERSWNYTPAIGWLAAIIQCHVHRNILSEYSTRRVICYFYRLIDSCGFAPLFSSTYLAIFLLTVIWQRFSFVTHRWFSWKKSQHLIRQRVDGDRSWRGENAVLVPFRLWDLIIFFHVAFLSNSRIIPTTFQSLSSFDIDNYKTAATR